MIPHLKRDLGKTGTALTPVTEKSRGMASGLAWSKTHMLTPRLSFSARLPLDWLHFWGDTALLW